MRHKGGQKFDSRSNAQGITELLDRFSPRFLPAIRYSQANGTRGTTMFGEFSRETSEKKEKGHDLFPTKQEAAAGPKGVPSAKATRKLGKLR